MKIEARNAIFFLLLIVLPVNGNCISIEWGMYWGFSVGDAFWFTMNYTGEYDDMNNQEGYIQVDRYPLETPFYSGRLVDFGLGM